MLGTSRLRCRFVWHSNLVLSTLHNYKFEPSPKNLANFSCFNRGLASRPSKKNVSVAQDLGNSNVDKVEDLALKQLDDEIEDDMVKAAEAQVKRKMVSQKSMYGQALLEAEPDDEAAILEYYVRKAQDSLEETDESIEYGVLDPKKKIFFRMVDLWIQDAGEVRRGHREFVQVSLNNLERFDVQNEPNAYLKILQCYPQSVHTGMRRNKWFGAVFQDKILDHELAVKVFSMMRKYNVVPNDEFYDVSMQLFGKYSRATASVRSLLFWYPRLTQFIKFPVSNKELETMTRPEIALHALRQASPCLNTEYKHFEILEDSAQTDMTDSEKSFSGILSAQTREQKALLESHDRTKPVFVEGPYKMYFKNELVQYYILRADPLKKEEEKETHKLLTDKEWWEKFYRKDYDSSRTYQDRKYLFDRQSFFPKLDMDDEETLVKLKETRNQIKEVTNDVPLVEGKVYGMAATDAKSIDALRSWIFGLESTNPILSQITVLFNEKQSFLSEGYKHLLKD